MEPPKWGFSRFSGQLGPLAHRDGGDGGRLGSSTSPCCGQGDAAWEGADLVVEAHFGVRVITWADP